MQHLENITSADLRSDERLTGFYVEAIKRKLFSNNVESVFNFWCLAEKALRDDAKGTPGKLFSYFIKKSGKVFINSGIEKTAMQRMGSCERQKLVDQTNDKKELTVSMNEETDHALIGRGVGYNHSIMMQCFLPQKKLPVSQRDYQISHGKASLLIEAGKLANPNRNNHFIQAGIPYGSRARLIIPFINSYAISRKTRTIDLGKSLRRFMENIGSPITGNNGKEFVKQIQAISAAQFILGEWNEHGAVTKYARVTNKIAFWLERDERQFLLWNPEMELSQDYYDSLKDHRCPISIDHLIKLARSPRRMDIYTWLSYRLPSIFKTKEVKIKLSDIQAIFAPDINPTNVRLFKQRLNKDMKAIANVYRYFNIEIKGDNLIMHKSIPPIPQQFS